ncbi:MAG: hypothetical protein R2688_05910 [Fimbriimonadaceae bacterium]
MKQDWIWMVATGLVAAIATDYHAFWKSKQNDPSDLFDWGLAFKRALIGVLSGGGFAAALIGGQ